LLIASKELFEKTDRDLLLLDAGRGMSPG